MESNLLSFVCKTEFLACPPWAGRACHVDFAIIRRDASVARGRQESCGPNCQRHNTPTSKCRFDSQGSGIHAALLQFRQTPDCLTWPDPCGFF
jgi:hypothetical protein